MSQAVGFTPTTYAAYREAEQTSEVRHEFLRGNVVAMAGGTPEHAALSMTVGAMLVDGLRGKRCRVFSAALRVRVIETDLATYPDVSVVCQPLEYAADDPHAVVSPTVVVEILSESTEAYDRGEKAAHYRRIPSLKAYLLVSQRERRLELYTRTDSDRWELTEALPTQKLELPALGLSLDVDAVYADPLDSA